MFYWRLYPFVRIALAFVSGILLADFLPLSFLQIFIFIFALSIIGWLAFESLSSRTIFGGHAASWCIFIFFFSAGFLRYSYNSPKDNPDYFITSDRDTIFLVGLIQEIPKLQKRAKTFVEVRYVNKGKDSDFIPASGKLLCYFNAEDSTALSYKPGDKVLIYGVVKKVETTKNPNTFDYESYLRYRKVLYQAHISPENHHILSRGELFFFIRYAMEARDYFLQVFERRLDNKDQLTIASALVLGFRNQLDPDLYQAFSDTGAVHVLAVSGLHVGIICAILIFFFDRIKSKSTSAKVMKAICLILLVWFFAFMTGAAPAVTRAATMFSLFLIGRYWFDYVNVYNILGFCALIMLINEPYLLFQASFQFSFLALTSLVFFQPFVNSVFAFANPLLKYSWNLISVSIAAQVLVFPITIYFFHKFPSYFMLSGLLAVPLAMICLVIGLAILLLEPVLPLLNDLLAPMYKLTLEIFIGSIQSIRAIPYSSINGLWLTSFELIIIYAMMILLMIAFQLKRVKPFYYMAGCALVLSCSLSCRTFQTSRQLFVIVYDVYSGSLLDVFDGHEIYALKTATLTPVDMQFIANNHRQFRKSRAINEYAFEDQYRGSRTMKSSEILAVGNTLIYIPKIALHKHVKVDYVLLMDGMKLKPPSSEIFDQAPKMIISDRSVPPYITSLWKKYAEEKGIGYHDVKVQGVWEHIVY